MFAHLDVSARGVRTPSNLYGGPIHKHISNKPPATLYPMANRLPEAELMFIKTATLE